MWRSSLTSCGIGRRMLVSSLKETNSMCNGCLNPLRKGHIWPMSFSVPINFCRSSREVG
jgi:hypothetical protein